MNKKASQLPPWFSLERYAWIEPLLKDDPSLLCYEFDFRAEALSCGDARIKANICESIAFGCGRIIESLPYDPESWHDDAVNTLENAILEAESSNPNALLESSYPVSAMKVADLVRLSLQTDQALLDIGERVWDGSDVTEHLSIDSHVTKRHPPHPIESVEVHCKIRLDYSDDAILENLRNVLPVWRRQLNEAAGRDITKPQTANTGLAKLVSYRLIPILDLKLWADEKNLVIPVRTLVAAIFPNGERGEDDYRKTIQPLLNGLVTRQGRRNLFSAAFITELAKNRKLSDV